MQTVEEVVANDDDGGAAGSPPLARTDGLDARRRRNCNTFLWLLYCYHSDRNGLFAPRKRARGSQLAGTASEVARAIPIAHYGFVPTALAVIESGGSGRPNLISRRKADDYGLIGGHASAVAVGRRDSRTSAQSPRAHLRTDRPAWRAGRASSCCARTCCPTPPAAVHPLEPSSTAPPETEQSRLDACVSSCVYASAASMMMLPTPCGVADKRCVDARAA